MPREIAHKSPIIFDAHACPPLGMGKDLSGLKLYKDAGIHFVSLNVGYGDMTPEEIFPILIRFRCFLNDNATDYTLVKNSLEIEQCKRENKLAVAFDLEGANALDGKLELLDEYKQLGVQQMLLAYNKNNNAAGGCLDNDLGLTRFGKQIVNRMNQVGVLIDCSHTGKKSTFDIMEASTEPVIFSHANPAALCNHQRNITDEQIKACANTGGAIGISGINIFLGCDVPDAKKLVEHIDYVAQLVGPDHVGLGLDYVLDHDELKQHVKSNSHLFPPNQQFDAVELLSPTHISAIRYELNNKGYKKEQIEAILGGNFMRITKQVW